MIRPKYCARVDGRIERTTPLILAGLAGLLCGIILGGAFVRKADSTAGNAVPPTTALGPVSHVWLQEERRETMDDSSVLRKVTELDSMIGARSIDQEIAAEFAATIYHGTVVAVSGKATKGGAWGDVSQATVEMTDGTAVDLELPQSISDCMGCPALLEHNAGNAARWHSEILGKDVIATGEILRQYKPTLEQKVRMSERLRHSQIQGSGMRVPVGYFGGFYTYRLILKDVAMSGADAR